METGAKMDEAERRSHTRVLVIATDELAGDELIGELRGHLRESGSTEVMVIAPAVERTAFQHALGDVDKAVKEAEQRLETSLEELGRAGVPALGEVGDSDPLIAAEDALRQFIADEVLIVAHAEDQARWFEDGLFARAQQELRPALRMVTVRREGDEPEPHLAGIEESGEGQRTSAGAKRELTLSANMPRITPGDLSTIVVAIAGTIVAIVLAATGPGSETAGGAAQILIAMAVALINMAHVVSLTLLESVGHGGGWQSFFRNLSITATPLAVVANALISLLA